ncbi:multicopper oxidase domain-containing protein [Chloroflexi bacterium TSY]|nr:multicopper oxidase domain-containing protein [Chloroflexi bacterium TSY]
MIPKEDYQRRRASGINWPLCSNEANYFANFEFRLGKSAGAETHYPGTFWYHPHAHGATYDQVAGGMAGFLIVEGNVDTLLKQDIREYKERRILFQNLFKAVTERSG